MMPSSVESYEQLIDSLGGEGGGGGVKSSGGSYASQYNNRRRRVGAGNSSSSSSSSSGGGGGGGGGMGRGMGYGANSAATSHRANAQYMSDFESALSDMGLGGDGSATHAGEATRQRRTFQEPHASLSLMDGADAYSEGPNATAAPVLVGRFGGATNPVTPIASSSVGIGIEVGGGLRKKLVGSVAMAWGRGPSDPAGTLVDLSDRNILCLSVSPVSTEVVAGSADHGLYTMDLETGTKRRTLYSRRFGHSEWVSTVAHTSAGQVLSGGDDGKLCLWDHDPSLGGGGGGGGGGGRGGASAGVVPCKELEPRHRAPVSVLRCDATAPIAVSGSYDHSIRVWNVGDGDGGGGADERRIEEGTGRQAARSRGPRRRRDQEHKSAASELCRIDSHHAPVMALTWGSSSSSGGGGGAVMLSGDRDGALFFHDLNTGQAVRQLKHGTSHSHVTCVAHAGSAGGDGASTTLGGALAPAKGEAGPSSTLPGAEHLFYSGGQDGCVRVWDARADQCIANLKLHTNNRGTGALVDVIPCGNAAGDVLVTAAADRRICVVEARQSFSRRAVFSEHADFIYSLAVWGDVCLSGGGDGMLLAHDLRTSQSVKGSGGLLWGLGASSQGAVRAIAVASPATRGPGSGRGPSFDQTRLVAAGDDGNVLMYSF